MASSKLCHRLTSSFLLLHRRRTNLNLNRISLIPSLSPSTCSSLLLKSLYSSSSSSAALISEDDASLSPSSSSSSSSSSSAHPWPEWDQFVEKMKNEGYFAKDKVDDTSFGSSASSSSSYSKMDLNRIKNACLKFSRERYDILSYLPKEDIQSILQCGCPNLFRKAVNSAKRLRAFLGIDEGDVCSACNQRESCDRAYVIAKDDDQARTVDIMRILMSYAVEPSLSSGGTNPSMTEHAQESARKLLGELIKLSDTAIDPNFPKPEASSPSKKEDSQKSQKVVGKSKESKNVETKPGDWICSECELLNFARNKRCLKCKAEGPKRVEFSKEQMKLGDWTCPKCDFMNFSRNKTCFRCKESRPKRELNPGEWECPKCDFVNFKRNTACKKCQCERPAYDENSGFEDHLWKKPRTAKKITNFLDDEDEEKDSDDESDELLHILPKDKKKGATPTKRRLIFSKK